LLLEQCPCFGNNVPAFGTMSLLSEQWPCFRISATALGFHCEACGRSATSMKFYFWEDQEVTDFIQPFLCICPETHICFFCLSC
jgi:hypothetical protein